MVRYIFGEYCSVPFKPNIFETFGTFIRGQLSSSLKVWAISYHNSSLHNIIWNSFWLVLVLWRLLNQGFLFLTCVIVVPKSSCGDWNEGAESEEWKPHPFNVSFQSPQELFWTTMTFERNRKPRFNSLHNTKTSRNELQIILWRLL